MGIEYLWDTNIAIYFLQQQFPPSVEKFIDKLLLNSTPIISAITEIELLCWRTATEKDIRVLNGFVNDALVIELEKPIKMKTAEIRKAVRIKLPDAIIAATAIVHDFTLVTRNSNDFRKVDSLRLINPFDR